MAQQLAADCVMRGGRRSHYCGIDVSENVRKIGESSYAAVGGKPDRSLFQRVNNTN
jgi:hypothetical protein